MTSKQVVLEVFKDEAFMPRFNMAREIMESVSTFFMEKVNGMTTQAVAEEFSARRLKDAFRNEHIDMKQLIERLADVEKERCQSLKEKASCLDGPLNKIRRWLNDDYIKRSEKHIFDDHMELMNKYKERMASVLKLEKAYHKKCRLLLKTQRRIDHFPQGQGSDRASLSDLQIKLKRLSDEVGSTKDVYLTSLDSEQASRSAFIKDIQDVKNKFVSHDKNRLVIMAEVIGQYSSRLDNQSKVTLTAHLNDLMEMSLIYGPDDELDMFRECNTRIIEFPEFKEYVHRHDDRGETDEYNVYSGSQPPNTPTDASGNATNKIPIKRSDVSLDGSLQHSKADSPRTSSDLITPDCFTPTPFSSEYTRTPLPKMDELPKVESPEILTPRLRSRNERRTTQMLRNESSLDGNLLPQVRRSMVGTPEGPGPKAISHTPLKLRQKMDNGLPHVPCSVVENTEMLAMRSQSRNGASQPAPKAKSRMENNMLPKMPNIGTGNGMISSPFKAKNNQDNDVPLWERARAPYLPQVPKPREGARLETKSDADSLPVMPKLGANVGRVPPSYAKIEKRGTQPPMPSRGNDGYTILPSKPKIQMNFGNVQSLVSTKSAAENAARDGLRSRHSVGVVRQSRRLDSGIPAGFRGSSSKRDITPALQEQRGKADGAPNPTRPLMAVHDRNAMLSQRAPSGTGSWAKKEFLPEQDKPPQRVVGSWAFEDKRPEQDKSSQKLAGSWAKEDKHPKQDRHRNADDLLKMYDIKNLEDDSEEEDLFKNADRLLGMHDIRNIISDESLGEFDL